MVPRAGYRLLAALGLVLVVLGLTVGLVPVSASPYFSDRVGGNGGVFFEQRTRYDCGLPLLRQYKPTSLKGDACAAALRTERVVAAAALLAGSTALVCCFRARRRT